MNTTFEELLARDGRLVYKTRGRSMEPMLRQDRDVVIVERCDARLKPLDVALYRRGDRYVLHRVIALRDGGYLIRGDNTFALENVPDSAILGVLTAFQRKGKQITTENRAYLRYTRFWTAIYPLRSLCHAVRAAAVRAARRLGVLPLLRKVLHRE